MTLRDLLLQFAGENEKLLRASDLIEEKIDHLQFLSEENTIIKFLLIEGDSSEVVHKIDELLNSAEFEYYNITPSLVNGETIITVEL